MKKIYKAALSVALLMGAFTTAGAQTQNGAFFFDGKQLENGATISVEAEPDLYGSDKMMVETASRLTFRNLYGSALQNTSGKMVVDSENLSKIAGYQWCGLNGLCVSGDMTSGIIEKRGVMLAKDADDLQRADLMFEPGKYGEAIATITIRTGIGLEQYSVNLRGVYSDPAGIEDVSAAAKLSYAGNQLIYNFASTADYQLKVYSVSGALVKSQTISKSGSVSLGDLQKGIYVAQVTANGHKVASRKCFVD